MELNGTYREILEELVKCARALEEYREDVVVVGGLVPLLYRFYPDFTSPRQPTMGTVPAG